jgi:hypothetical protein
MRQHMLPCKPQAQDGLRMPCPHFSSATGTTYWLLACVVPMQHFTHSTPMLHVHHRYQILAGVIEERGIETLFKGNYKLTTALSFIVRTANTFLGSLLWVDFIRLLGMQKSG